MSNIIKFDGDTVIFEGFDNLGDVATFCFQPSGVVIVPSVLGPANNKITVEIHNKSCTSAALVDRLNHRGIITFCSFFFSVGRYFEDNPHKE